VVGIPAPPGTRSFDQSRDDQVLKTKVDLHRAGLFLVEIKSHSDKIANRHT